MSALAVPSCSLLHIRADVLPNHCSLWFPGMDKKCFTRDIQQQLVDVYWQVT